MSDKEVLALLLISAILALLYLRMDEFLEFLSRHIEGK
jgi:hypothetical protein